MTVGPLVCGVGTLLLVGVGAGSTYWTGVLPGISVFGLGLTLLVAPLTATVLAAAPDRYAGVASGVNNAVARAGSLLAVAALPAVVGLSGSDYAVPEAFSSAYRTAMLICAGLLAAGGVVSWLLIRNPVPRAVGPRRDRCRAGGSRGRGGPRHTRADPPAVVRGIRGMPGRATTAGTCLPARCRPGVSRHRPGQRGRPLAVTASGQASSLRGCRCCRRSPGTRARTSGGLVGVAV